MQTMRYAPDFRTHAAFSMWLYFLLISVVKATDIAPIYGFAPQEPPGVRPLQKPVPAARRDASGVAASRALQNRSKGMS
jgi:hypothetical protein